MDFSKYIFRCHYQGSLVSTPKPLTANQEELLSVYRNRKNGIGRPLTPIMEVDWHSLETKLAESKKTTLSDTAKKMLSDIVFYEKHGRNFQLNNKYLDKGILVEKDSRDLISDILRMTLTADPERKTNEWVTGQRDIKHSEIIIDNKASYSFETFNKHLTEANDEYYFRQLDCYMDLWKIPDSLLAYTLVDTPKSIIDDEIRRQNYQLDFLNLEGDVKEEKIETVVDLIQNHIYTRQGLEEYCQLSSIIKIEWFPNFREIPKSERVHFVNHPFDKTRIEQRNESLSLARKYMSSINPINNITINNIQSLFQTN